MLAVVRQKLAKVTRSPHRQRLLHLRRTAVLTQELCPPLGPPIMAGPHNPTRLGFRGTHVVRALGLSETQPRTRVIISINKKSTIKCSTTVQPNIEAVTWKSERSSSRASISSMSRAFSKRRTHIPKLPDKQRALSCLLAKIAHIAHRSSPSGRWLQQRTAFGLGALAISVNLDVPANLINLLLKLPGEPRKTLRLLLGCCAHILACSLQSSPGSLEHTVLIRTRKPRGVSDVREPARHDVLSLSPKSRPCHTSWSSVLTNHVLRDSAHPCMSNDRLDHPWFSSLGIV